MTLLLVACSEPSPPTLGLYPAIDRGDLDQVKRHIHWDTDINQETADGRSPLHLAAELGRPVITRMLVDNGAELEALDRQGRTPLYGALMAGRTQVAELLISRGAGLDPDLLLRETVVNGVGDRDVLDLLLRHGADINRLGADGNSPLTLAINHRQRVLVRLLIANGADVNQPDANGQLPLQLANSIQNQAIVQLLRRNGARLGAAGQ